MTDVGLRKEGITHLALFYCTSKKEGEQDAILLSSPYFLILSQNEFANSSEKKEILLPSSSIFLPNPTNRRKGRSEMKLNREAC